MPRRRTSSRTSFSTIACADGPTRQPPHIAPNPDAQRLSGKPRGSHSSATPCGQRIARPTSACGLSSPPGPRGSGDLGPQAVVAIDGRKSLATLGAARLPGPPVVASAVAVGVVSDDLCEIGPEFFGPVMTHVRDQPELGTGHQRRCALTPAGVDEGVVETVDHER